MYKQMDIGAIYQNFRRKINVITLHLNFNLILRHNMKLEISSTVKTSLCCIENSFGQPNATRSDVMNRMEKVRMKEDTVYY